MLAHHHHYRLACICSSRQLLNKTDLLSEEQLAELKEWYQTNCKADAVFTISALQVGCGFAGGGGWLHP